MTKGSFDIFYDSFIKSRVKKESIFISFWEGEPLINFSIIKYIIEKFDKIESIIVTNGTLINKGIAEFCKKYNIRLIITIDGPKEFHDKQRIYKNGKGTYCDIVKNINMLQYIGCPYAVRTTLTSNSPVPSVIIKNFKKHGIQGVFFTPVSPITTEDKELSKIKSKLIVEDLFESFMNDIEIDDCFIYKNVKLAIRAFFSKKPIKTCGIADNNITIKYNNDIYPCHRMVLSKERCIGKNNIKQGFSNYYDSIFENNLKCKKCQYRLFCGGYCRMEIIRSKDIQHISPEWYEFVRVLLKKTFKLIIHCYMNDSKLYNKIISIYSDDVDRASLINGISTKDREMDKFDIPFKDNKARSLDLDEEGLIYREDIFDTRYIANITSMAIWDLIDGYRSAEKIAIEIANACEIDLTEIEKDIYNTLQTFKELQLIGIYE